MTENEISISTYLLLARVLNFNSSSSTNKMFLNHNFVYCCD